MIEGLTQLTGPTTDGRMRNSKFALPLTFDVRANASKWVEDGPEVAEAAQPQIMEHCNMEARGWQVFRGLDTEATKRANEELNKDAKPGEKPKIAPPVLAPVIRVVGKRKFILLFRPKALQAAVNELYARQSRTLVNRELLGESASANPAGDAGILTNRDLRQAGAMAGEDLPQALPQGNYGANYPDPRTAGELQIQ